MYMLMLPRISPTQKSRTRSSRTVFGPASTPPDEDDAEVEDDALVDEDDAEVEDDALVDEEVELDVDGVFAGQLPPAPDPA